MMNSTDGLAFRNQFYPSHFVEPGKALIHLALLSYEYDVCGSTSLEYELDDGLYQSLGMIEEALLEDLGFDIP